MGKKKTLVKTAADALKDAGNEAQLAGNFAKAIELYTQAIEIDGTKAIYFSNRKLMNLVTL
jgi:tetratricopeptide (TPR) repeat protein